MTDRIASDEPDVVGLVPKPISFWFRGHQYQAAASRSTIGRARMIREAGGVLYSLAGEFGRAWLADPCSMALQHGLHASRMVEDKAAAQARTDRRKAKAALLEEEAAAKRTKTARW